MEIFDYFKIPSECLYTGQQPKVDDFLTMMNVDAKDKKIIKGSISKIELYAQIVEDNSIFWKYVDDTFKYECINVVILYVKNESNIKQINAIFQKALQDPTLIIFAYKDKYALGTALKRLNKVDNNKSVIDEIQITDFFVIDDIHKELIKRLNFNSGSLKDFYEHLDQVVSCDYIVRFMHRIPNEVDSNIKALSRRIQSLLEEKNKLIAQEKEESSMQGKMTCHMRIKEIEKQLESFK